jgi:hypothetical protein
MFCSGTGDDTFKVADVQPPKRERPPEPLGPPKPPSLNYDTDNPPLSCTCPTCKNACKERVGFFLPGEAEKVAEFKGLELQQLFDDFLTVDHHNGVFIQESTDRFTKSLLLKRRAKHQTTMSIQVRLLSAFTSVDHTGRWSKV